VCVRDTHTHSDTLTEHKAECAQDDLAEFALLWVVCLFHRDLYKQTR